jgi:hypothetical protein
MPKAIEALGASLLSVRELVNVVTRGRLDAAALDDVARAFDLWGPARDLALRRSKAGPELLAAVELGKRAWLTPPPAGRRVRGPADIAAIVRPRALFDSDALWVVALDLRLTVARVLAVEKESAPASALHAALSAGAACLIVAELRPSAAVPSRQDASDIARLAAAAALCGVSLLDHVMLGDDGIASALRLGLLSGGDPRYR